MAKMSNKLIALCSAAIGTIYIAGYAVTGHTQGILHVPGDGLLTPNDSLNQSNTSQSNTTTTQKTYQDGTFVGIGANNIGTVQVAVTIKNDQIEDVQITNCRTHYPQAYINGLPQQVVQRQSENIDVVSGATKSSQDFRTAVHQALLQAKLQSTNQSIANTIGAAATTNMTNSTINNTISTTLAPSVINDEHEHDRHGDGYERDDDRDDD